MGLGARALNQKRILLHFLCGTTVALANKTNVNTRVCAGTSGQKTAQGYFHFYVLHQHSGLAHQLLRTLTMTESSEKDYVVTKKLNMKCKIFGVGVVGITHISSHILFEIGL
jgi:hypothetical protein